MAAAASQPIVHVYVYDRIKNIQRWLMPAACALCGARCDQDLCADCDRALPRLGPGCPQCAAPVAGIACDAPAPCGRCQRRPPAYDRVRALYSYALPVDRMILGLKYGRRIDWARVLGERLANRIAASGSDIDVIIPVPLHRQRLRERGYNQSLELTRPVAARLDRPLVLRGVTRARATAPQTGLSATLRRRNMRNAFDVTRDFDGRRIAMVDDVMTSGATVDAFARCLKRAGAAYIEVWVVARA